jgi:hypothetical protein
MADSPATMNGEEKSALWRRRLFEAESGLTRYLIDKHGDAARTPQAPQRLPRAERQQDAAQRRQTRTRQFPAQTVSCIAETGSCSTSTGS